MFIKAIGWVTSWVGIIAIATSCAGTKSTQNSPPVIEPENAAVVSPTERSVAQSPGAPVPQPSPIASANVPNPRLPVPNLTPPTVPNDRLPSVAVGRSEPFGAIADTPIVRPRSTVATPPTAPTVPASVAPTPTVVPTPTVRQPQVTTSPIPVVTPNANEPIEEVAPSAPVPTSPTSIADGIEISGVIQTGGRINAIVQVPGEATSRYVSAGDYLASGRVFVKRIDANTEEPLVILEQNGVEIIRTVGSVNTGGA